VPILLNDAVNREMGVDSTHFVAESLCYTSDHVGNERLDGTQACIVLAAALPDSEVNLVHLSRNKANVHVNMADILCEGSTGALHSDEAGLDGDLNVLRNIEIFCLEDVLHLQIVLVRIKFTIEPIREPNVPSIHSFPTESSQQPHLSFRSITSQLECKNSP
jgi:hypothetical protein